MILIMVGLPGSGKTSLAKELVDFKPTNSPIINNVMEEFGEFKSVVSCTTRSAREGEVDGLDYFYLTQEEFENLIENDEFIEYTKVYGEYKGLPKPNWSKPSRYDSIESISYSQSNVVMILDPKGTKLIKNMYPDALVVYLDIPSKLSEARMVRRGDDELSISKRMLEIKSYTDFRDSGFADAIIDSSTPIDDTFRRLVMVLDASKDYSCEISS